MAKAKKKATRKTRAAAPPPPRRARVRMYRGFFGDCFLISIPRDEDGTEAHLMIDCGILLGSPNAESVMTDCVEDIARVTGGKVDVLAVTHEHWDHVSGFLQASDAFKKIEFGAVWMSWAEDPEDPQARKLDKARDQALHMLGLAEAQLGLAGAPEAEPLAAILSFFGSAGRTTRDALSHARGLAGESGARYLEPGSTLEFAGTGARIHVLGPPRDEKLLLRSQPSSASPETFHFALDGVDPQELAECLRTDDPDAPFVPRWRIPMPLAQTMPFFRDGLGAAGDEWRRIDLAWLEGATELALKLDANTNNSSLVLAIELASGEVLLFAGDAQVGNWLSWQDLELQDGRKGPDLLARTVLYKVGHHGSHNATLHEKGLFQMTDLRIAMIPVDEETARRRRWNRIPLNRLVEELDVRTGGRVLRSDADAPAATEGMVSQTPLYFDIHL